MHLSLNLLYTVAVVCFIGNTFSGLYWKIVADEQLVPNVVRSTFNGIFRSDRLITIPSLLVVEALNFHVNDGKMVPLLNVPIAPLIVAFSISGLLLFILIVHPTRMRLRNIAVEWEQSGAVQTDEYKALSTRWVIFGVMELAPLIAVLTLSLIL